MSRAVPGGCGGNGPESSISCGGGAQAASNSANERAIRRRVRAMASPGARAVRQAEHLARDAGQYYNGVKTSRTHKDVNWGRTMFGLIQDRPLLVSSLLLHADRHHGATEIVTRTVEGPIHRHTIRDAHRRARQLARALRRLGVVQSECVATLAWNTHRHFEFYYAVSGIGAICHIINPRLFHEQIVYIINHADDRYVFFDLSFAPLVAKLTGVCHGVKGWVALTDRAHMPASVPDALCYEEVLAAEDDDFAWPVFDERLASSLCYTSGTTGNPKGALYSHRSTVL